MPDWMVLLRTSEGTQMIPVTADLARESDDGKTLEFSNVAPFEEAVSILLDFEQAPPTEAQKEKVWKLIRALGRIQVASFKLASVEGYYQEGSEEGPAQ